MLPGDDDDGEGVFEAGGEDGVDREVGGDGLEGVEFGVGDLVGLVGEPDDAVFEGVDGVAIGDGGRVDAGGEWAGVVMPAGGGEARVRSEGSIRDVRGGWVGDRLAEQRGRCGEDSEGVASEEDGEQGNAEGEAAGDSEAAG